MNKKELEEVYKSLKDRIDQEFKEMEHYLEKLSSVPLRKTYEENKEIYEGFRTELDNCPDNIKDVCDLYNKLDKFEVSMWDRNGKAIFDIN